MVKQLSSVRFDWTISVGNLLSIAVVIGGGVAAWFTMKGDVRDLSTRMAAIEKGADKRDGDHDRLVELAADVKYMRAVIEREKRADTATAPRIPHP